MYKVEQISQRAILVPADRYNLHRFGCGDNLIHCCEECAYC